jgi:hypothetical protein
MALDETVVRPAMKRDVGQAEFVCERDGERDQRQRKADL